MNKNLEQSEIQFGEIQIELYELFARKNREYGNNYFRLKEKAKTKVDKLLAELDYYVQLSRKVSRLEEIYDCFLDTGFVNTESLREQLMDIACYSIMELCKLKDEPKTD